MKKSEKATIFSERLRKIRKASGMTQQEIADHLNMQRSTYAYYETGATPSSPCARQNSTSSDNSTNCNASASTWNCK